ncbi:MAG: NUDIX hydrolase [Chitinophagales bacterium]
MSFLFQNIKVSVDVAAFAYKDEQLFLLLQKQEDGLYKDQWSLPGESLFNNESLLGSAKRALVKTTTSPANYIEQTQVIGEDVFRDNRGHILSVVHSAFFSKEKMKFQDTVDKSRKKWFAINELPQTMAFDHSKIIEFVIEKLREAIHFRPISFEMLEDEFRFSDVEVIYSQLLEKELDRRNFRKKLLAFPFIEKTLNKVSTGNGRPAYLYRYNREKYSTLLATRNKYDLKFI